MPPYSENYSLTRKGFKTSLHTHTHKHILKHTHTHTFSRAGVAGKGVEWNGRGVVVLWVKGGMGVSVSPTLTHHLGHRVWMVGWNAPTVLLNAPLLPHMTIYWSCKSKRL